MKKMKAKISALILVLALVFTMAPTTLFADGTRLEYYNLYVSGILVSSENADDVLGDGGSVKYDKVANKLTLDNACIKMEYVNDRYGYAGIYYGTDSVNFDIELKGENTIVNNKTGNLGSGIYITGYDDVKFMGNGTLNIDIEKAYNESYGIYTGEPTELEFTEDVDINITAPDVGMNVLWLYLEDNSKVKVESGTDAINSYSGSFVTVNTSSVLEVYARTGVSALPKINSGAGNLKQVGAFAGATKYDSVFYHWTGDDGGPEISSYSYLRIPYADDAIKNVSYDPGDKGTGTMIGNRPFKGSRIELPLCSFDGKDNYSFVGWQVGNDAKIYKPGDFVEINSDTTITAIWTRVALDLFIGGKQVNSDNMNDVFGDGTVSVSLAESPGGRPGEVFIVLNNATIEMDKLSDASNPNSEFGIRSNIENKKMRIYLKGENKIVNKRTYTGITEVIGIKSNSSVGNIIYGDGTLEVQMDAERNGTDNHYYGIDVEQSTTIEGSKVNVDIGGTYDEKAGIKGLYIHGPNTVSLTNNTELNINTSYGYAFDNNNKDEGSVNLDVEEGSIFKATSKWAVADAWYAVHGNGWVSFSEDTLTQGVVVSKKSSGEDATVWDGTEDIGVFSYVHIPDSITPPETTTQPQTTKQPETTKAPTPTVVKKANPIIIKAKKKSIKAKKLKKKSLKVKALKVRNAVGTVTFKKVKKGTTKKIYKKVKVTKKGVLKFKKGKYKKKTYKIKVKITASGNDTYLAKTVIKTVKVKIK